MKPVHVYQVHQYHLDYENGASLMVLARVTEQGDAVEKKFSVRGSIKMTAVMPDGRTVEQAKTIEVPIEAADLAEAIERAQLTFEAELQRITSAPKPRIMIPQGPPPLDLRGGGD